MARYEPAIRLIESSDASWGICAGPKATGARAGSIDV